VNMNRYGHMRLAVVSPPNEDTSFHILHDGLAISSVTVDRGKSGGWHDVPLKRVPTGVSLFQMEVVGDKRCMMDLELHLKI
jgi:hypothetical protein